jgi:Fur family iron response transcriptional regulator
MRTTAMVAAPGPISYSMGIMAEFDHSFRTSARPATPVVTIRPAGNGFADALRGCPMHDLRARLRVAGMRPTRQRLALGWLLYGKGHRHVTAERLFEEAVESRVPVSLATIYNTLHQFTRAGLLREIATDGAKTHFDTNTSDHHHFLFETNNELTDISPAEIEIHRLPDVPEGMEIARIDVVVRLRPKIEA